MDEWLRGLPGEMGYWAVQRAAELLPLVVWAWMNREKLRRRKLISAMGESTGGGFATIKVGGIPSEEQVGAPMVRVQEKLPAWEELVWWYVRLR